MRRAPTIIGNWKMYKTIQEATEFVEKLAPSVANSQARVCLAVPYTCLQAMAQKIISTRLIVGAQNMSDAVEGAFTGEISGRMIKDAGARFVLLGHSERRQIFKETDQFINRKIKRALEEKLEPILCIGETQQEREAGKTKEILEKQLRNSLAGLTSQELSHLSIAYEPVWAIGTGNCATPEIAQDTHHFCRQMVAMIWGKEEAQKLAILYGGSVKPDNAAVLMHQQDIDGVLVGGASLKPDLFGQIVNFQ